MKKLTFLALLMVLVSTTIVIAADQNIYVTNGVGLTTEGNNDHTALYIILNHNKTITYRIGTNNPIKLMFTDDNKRKVMIDYFSKAAKWIKQNKTTKADGDKIIGDIEGNNGAMRFMFMAHKSGKASLFLLLRDDVNMKNIFLDENQCNTIVKSLSNENINSVGKKLTSKSDMSSFN